MYLRYLAPLLDASGYASASRGYVISCDRIGIKIQCRDRSRSINLFGKGIDQPILDMYERLSKTEVPHDCPTVQHTVADQFYVDKRSSRSIGFTIFEMPRVPSSWVEPCNKMHEIWTGSEYSAEAFKNSGVTVPISVLPHAIDVDAFDKAEPWQIKNRRGFAFLSIMDLTDRKCWRELLRAYWTAFDNKDDVCLIFKAFFGSFNDSARGDIIRRIATYRESLGFSSDRAPILLYGHDVGNSDMPGLYKAADCYVGISREGFGLSFAESMAAGIACIGPEVGGTRNFMNEDNSFLVKYAGDKPISEEMVRLNPIFEGLTWATHSWEDLAAKMRLVVSDADLRKEKAYKGKKYLKEYLTYEHIGRRISSLLSVR